jgi:hypothetical protein
VLRLLHGQAGSTVADRARGPIAPVLVAEAAVDSVPDKPGPGVIGRSRAFTRSSAVGRCEALGVAGVRWLEGRFRCFTGPQLWGLVPGKVVVTRFVGRDVLK